MSPMAFGAAAEDTAKPAIPSATRQRRTHAHCLNEADTVEFTAPAPPRQRLPGQYLLFQVPRFNSKPTAAKQSGPGRVQHRKSAWANGFNISRGRWLPISAPAAEGYSAVPGR